MKKNKMTVLALLTLCGVVWISPVSQADDAPKTDKKAAHQPGTPGEARRDNMKRIAEQLKLTDDQKDKFKAILQEQAQKMRELRQDKSLSREEKAAKFKELHDANQAKIKAIFTSEQWDKWQKLNSRSPRGHRRGSNAPKTDKP